MQVPDMSVGQIAILIDGGSLQDLAEQLQQASDPTQPVQLQLSAEQAQQLLAAHDFWQNLQAGDVALGLRQKRRGQAHCHRHRQPHPQKASQHHRAGGRRQRLCARRQTRPPRRHGIHISICLTPGKW